MIKYFPKDKTPRSSQVEAIDFISRAIEAKKRFIVLEAPTGSGKSPIAVTLANWSNDAFILTPAVGLQKQYQDDFPELRLAKGRAHYPCTYENPELNNRTVFKITNGQSIPKPRLENSCAYGKCMNKTAKVKKQIIDDCSNFGPCPYEVMIDEAIDSSKVVFNYHAFFYQAYMAGKFKKRKVMVIDEAHKLEDFLRGAMSTKFTIPRRLIKTDVSTIKKLTQWARWLRFDENVSLFHNKENKEAYLAKIEQLEKAGEKVYGSEPIVEITIENNRTVINFTPIYVGGSAHEFLFNFAETIVFMSGTIYNKKLFGAPLGIKEDELVIKRLKSDFPSENRPIVKPKTTLDLSHKFWDTNFQELVKRVKRIINHHGQEKGIILTSSYKMSKELMVAVGDTRMITHTNENLAQTLDKFFKSENKILVSCSVNEGVDFKDDLARFNIIIRPAYPSVQDPFIKYQLANNRWDYYYYKALVTFGQQVGRGVRSNEDWATTYLMDSRFNKFLDKCDKWLPDWFKEGYVK